MEIKISDGTYRDVPCVNLESECLLVKVIPDSGGKIQSIFDRRTQTEALYQTNRATFTRPYYGMPFDEGDLSGFDDMFPTISACRYPDVPWEGIGLPDHGEVWSLPWDSVAEGGSLTLSCRGVRLPYLLQKRLTFSRADTLSLAYRAQNCSPFPLRFIWAAHPLVRIDESSEVLLPPEVKEIFHTYDGPRQPDAFGRTGGWAEEKARYGAIADPAEPHCGKFYVDGELRTGESAVYSNRTHQYVKFRVPTTQVPYLGVWVNWDGYTVPQKNMALEPCTGAPDAIDVASRYGRISELPPNGTYEWSLEIELGTAARKETLVGERHS
ncbi:MAG: hypothetical protein LLF75_02530 [Eubacteriales bacterium]|nr:hypothetical protein [Eubacteriales bacterium]